MCCSLYDASEDQPVPVAPSTALAGTLVSSLHRLKDVDNNGMARVDPLESQGKQLTGFQMEGFSYLETCPSSSKGNIG